MSNYKIKQGDCLEILPNIEDNSIDMIFCDLPYQATDCKWDIALDLEKMWTQLNRIIKDNGAMVFTATQPFTSILVTSNIKDFRCEWIYQKAVGSNYANYKKQPLKEHESILVFSKQITNYYPIKEPRKGSGLKRVQGNFNTNSKSGGDCYRVTKNRNNAGKKYDDLRYPSSVQFFNNRAKGDRGLHPTQKPLELCKYFINTYSKENDVILDFCMGSGTTCIAALQLNRKFIGIEKDEKYFNIAKERIQQEIKNENIL